MLEGIWVRISLLGAAIWLLMSGYDILIRTSSLTVMVDLLGFTVIGLVVIVFSGLGLQWITDYLLDRRAVARN